MIERSSDDETDLSRSSQQNPQGWNIQANTSSIEEHPLACVPNCPDNVSEDYRSGRSVQEGTNTDDTETRHKRMTAEMKSGQAMVQRLNQARSYASGGAKQLVPPSEQESSATVSMQDSRFSLADVATSLMYERRQLQLFNDSRRAKNRPGSSITERKLQALKAASNCSSVMVTSNLDMEAIAAQFEPIINSVEIPVMKDAIRSNSKSGWIGGTRKMIQPYQSISCRLSEAFLNSESFAEFVRKSFGIIFHTSTVTALLILGAFFHSILFFVGVKYMSECPVQPKIPIYLLVAGAVGFLRLFNLLWQKYRRMRQMRNEEEGIDHEVDVTVVDSRDSRFTVPVINLLLFSWFVTGNVWTIKIYKPRFVPVLQEPSNWCDVKLYSLTLIYIFSAHLLLLVIAIFFVSLFICALKPSLLVDE